MGVRLQCCEQLGSNRCIIWWWRLTSFKFCSYFIPNWLWEWVGEFDCSLEIPQYIWLHTRVQNCEEVHLATISSLTSSCSPPRKSHSTGWSVGAERGCRNASSSCSWQKFKKQFALLLPGTTTHSTNTGLGNLTALIPGWSVGAEMQVAGKSSGSNLLTQDYSTVDSSCQEISQLAMNAFSIYACEKEL